MMQQNRYYSGSDEPQITLLQEKLANLTENTSDVLHKTWDDIESLDRTNAECANRVRELELLVQLASYSKEANQASHEAGPADGCIRCPSWHSANMPESTCASATVIGASDRYGSVTTEADQRAGSLKRSVGRLLSNNSPLKSSIDRWTSRSRACQPQPMRHHAVENQDSIDSEIDLNTRIDSIQSRLKEKELALLTLKQTHQRQENAISAMRDELERLRRSTGAASESKKQLHALKRKELVLTNKITEQDLDFFGMVSTEKEMCKTLSELKTRLRTSVSKNVTLDIGEPQQANAPQGKAALSA